MYWRVDLFAALLISFTSLHIVVAQIDDSSGSVGDNFDPINEGLEVEELYDELGKGDKESPVTTTSKKKKEKIKSVVLEKLSQLSMLAPFEDIAVISRKFLPKRRRFELSGGGLLILNNAFFNNIGFALRGTFYLSEKWGVEAQYYSLYASERRVTEDLESFRRISTRSLVVPKNFMGAAIKWAPIYGKMSLFEKRIIPFDLFFSLGYGSTEIQEGGAGTLQLGMGQNFAISKSLAFRWDILWNGYSAEIIRKGGSRETLNHSDLYCGIGLSFFVPEAKYR